MNALTPNEMTEPEYGAALAKYAARENVAYHRAMRGLPHKPVKKDKPKKRKFMIDYVFEALSTKPQSTRQLSRATGFARDGINLSLRKLEKKKLAHRLTGLSHDRCYIWVGGPKWYEYMGQT